MTLKIVFVMDPLDALALKKDSTLAMIRAAQRRGWEIFYVQQADLLLHEHAHRVIAKYPHGGPWREFTRAMDEEAERH